MCNTVFANRLYTCRHLVLKGLIRGNKNVQYSIIHFNKKIEKFKLVNIDIMIPGDSYKGKVSEVLGLGIILVSSPANKIRYKLLL